MGSFQKTKFIVSKHPRYVLIGILALVLLAVLGYYQERHQNLPLPDPVVPVLVSKAIRQNLERQLTLVGSVYPYESVAVHTRLDSQIVKVHFQDGDKVEAGQILFELDNRVLKAQLQQQQAILQRNQAELDRATRKFERDKKLLNKGFSSAEQIEASRQAYESSLATLQAAKALMDSLSTQLDYACIRAPIQGRAGTINLTAGNVVKTTDNQPLVIINQTKPLKIKVSIPQDYYEDVRLAQSLGPLKMVAFNAKKEELAIGTLDYRENSIDEQTRTLAVWGIFENREERLWPGMFVDVTLVLGVDKNVLVIPLVALQNDQEGQYVFIVKDNQAYKKSVKILRTQNDKAVIEGGITEGDLIVTDGIVRLREKSQVLAHIEDSLQTSSEKVFAQPKTESSHLTAPSSSQQAT